MMFQSPLLRSRIICTVRVHARRRIARIFAPGHAPVISVPIIARTSNRDDDGNDDDGDDGDGGCSHDGGGGDGGEYYENKSEVFVR